MNNTNKRMETIVIHHGYDVGWHFGSLSVPIFQTSTFTFATAEQGEARFAGREDGYIYSRLANPTVRVLEEKMARLEGGEAALAFSSGMAAVSAVLFALTKANDHIICSQGVYGCTFGLLQLLKKNITFLTIFAQWKRKRKSAALSARKRFVFMWKHRLTQR